MTKNLKYFFISYNFNIYLKILIFQKGRVCAGDTCLINQFITKRESLKSRSGKYELKIRENGMYLICDGNSIWSNQIDFTDVQGSYVQSEIFRQTHFVMYDSGAKIVWTALVSTDKKVKGEKIVLRNDGNLVFEAIDKTILWESGSFGKCPTGKVISQNQAIDFLK